MNGPAAPRPWPQRAFGSGDAPSPRPAAQPAFASILFPPELASLAADRGDAPDFFIDLNLDQVVTAVVDKRDEAVLRPFFYTPYRNEKIVRYRQGVFADLERPEMLPIFPAFTKAVRLVRSILEGAGQIAYPSHRHCTFLYAVHLWCEAVAAMTPALRAAAPRSAGLQQALDYFRRYLASGPFCRLHDEAEELRSTLSGLEYGMLFHGDKVTVRKYACEPDYTVTILERFARFRPAGAARPAPRKIPDDLALNHVEQAILDFASRLFPAAFRQLAGFADSHAGFIDPTIARFAREIDFYLSWLGFIEPLKRSGLPFCYPTVSTTSKETGVTGSFDIALASRLAREGSAVIRNSFSLSGPERLLVVSGPNQGGKTTFARMSGQLHFLAGLGCPVPGETARLFLPDRIFTHFEREEHIASLRSKLEDELVRLRATCEAMTPDSLIVLNEIFGSTSLDDQVFLSTRILERILAADAPGVCVTFIDSLSRLNERTVSMVSTVDPGDPARRTFEVVRRPADGLAYALALARKHGVTYEQLRRRVRP